MTLKQEKDDNIIRRIIQKAIQGKKLIGLSKTLHDKENDDLFLHPLLLFDVT
jgi:hypothetical protein